MKITRKARVGNSLGLHTRPASDIVKALQEYRSSVFFTLGDETVNARSIMSILMLAAEKDAEITMSVEGDDAEKTVLKLEELLSRDYGKE